MEEAMTTEAMFAVTARCGDCGGSNTIRMPQRSFSRAYVDTFAGLLDGSSPLYVVPVPATSPIGMCAVCRGRLSCTVTEEPAIVEPVDRDAREVIGTVPEGVDHRTIGPDGQQVGYVVLTAAERAKGFVRPVRRTYLHAPCGRTTTMGTALAETYARDPSFYDATFCAPCGSHFPVGAGGEFTWEGTAEKVGT
jgi:hypothetical protein